MPICETEAENIRLKAELEELKEDHAKLKSKYLAALDDIDQLRKLPTPKYQPGTWFWRPVINGKLYLFHERIHSVEEPRYLAVGSSGIQSGVYPESKIFLTKEAAIASVVEVD